MIGNTLRASDSKGEAIKGVTRHPERSGKLGSEKKYVHSNDMKTSIAQKARPGKSSLIDASFMMTKEGTFTMISRAVVVRHLGGLLCAVGPMVSLF